MLVFTRRPGERFRIRFNDGTVYWVHLLEVGETTIEVDIGRGNKAAYVDLMACTQFWKRKFSLDELCTFEHNGEKISMEIGLMDDGQVRLGFDGRAEVLREELVYRQYTE